MTVLWIILEILGGLIGLILLIAALSKKSYSVKRSIRILQPKALAFHAVSSLVVQDAFSKWANIDPNMKKEYVGTDRTVGFISKWESPHKQVGQGEQEIKRIIAGERVETEIRFLKPMRGIAQGGFDVRKVSDIECEVSWFMSSSMPYPFNFFLLVINMENMLGKDFEEGLANLKQILEHSNEHSITS